MVLSEHTKHMDMNEVEKTNENITKMGESELVDYLNNVEPDMMGFYGKEGVDDEHEN